MKRYPLCILLPILMTTHASSQQTNTMIPPSPDAAALGVYGSIPVSTYTGIPNISVPLYDIQYRDISLSIGLSYHSAGITVEQDASWVGLGWTLNVGGVITRTIKGGDDLQTINDGYSSLGGLTYQGYPYDAGTGTPNLGMKICVGDVDPEPDVFYFNFLGKSGSFVLEKGQSAASNKIVGVSLNAEKIEIIYDKINYRWQIRTSDGYTYHFKTMETVETLHGSGAYGAGTERVQYDNVTRGFLSWNDFAVSSWYLDKVISPLGEQVSYIYDVVDEMANNVPTGRKYSRYGSASFSFTDRKKTTTALGSVEECYTPSLQTSATKTFTNNIYLKEIQHSLGKIVFNKSLREDILPAAFTSTTYPHLMWAPWFMTWTQFGPQKLDNIIFEDNQGATVKKFEFLYGYINSQVTGNDKYNFRRLRLDKIRECTDQGCKPYYQLFYDESHPLPSKYSNAQDFWGYYNGKHNNISRVPYGTFYNQTDNKFCFLGDSDRQPDADYMTSGTLKKIIYPTGGSTEFEFEPHDYAEFGNDAFTLTDFDNNEPIPVTELYATEGAAAFYTTTFTLTEAAQNISIAGKMTYYPSATSSDPCNVTNPGSLYSGSEIWYSLRNVSTSATVVSHYMSDFLNYFSSNYNNNCVNPYRPDAIEPIYTNEDSRTLGAGTYELKVYARHEFNIHVIVSKRIIHDRVISKNFQNIFAKTAGGLRIKKITTKDNMTSNDIVKSYDYTVTQQNGDKRSTGTLMMFPSYHIPHYCTDFYLQQNMVGIMGMSWSNTPLATSASGSIVGYDKVTEYNGTAKNMGKTEYFYYNQEEEPSPNFILIEGFPTRKRTSNGLVTDIKYFDASGNILKTENFEYTRQLEKNFSATASKHLILLNWGVLITQCHNDGQMVLEDYYLVSDRWVVNKKTERAYSQLAPNFIESITDYSYDTQTHLQLKSEESYRSNGDLTKTTFLYPVDASWIPVSMWQDKFIHNKVVEKKSFKNNSLRNTYRAVYGAQANTFLLNSEQISTGTASAESVKTYSYYGNGAVKDITSRNGGVERYIWDYKSSFPIARVNSNSLVDSVAATSFEADDKGNWTYSGVVATASPGVIPPTGNKYYKLSVTTPLSRTVTVGNTYVVSYWRNTVSSTPYTISGGTSTVTKKLSSADGNWSYFEHKVTASSNTLSINYTTGTNYLDEVRLYPVNDLMITYTYNSTGGITSQCDENGKTIFYTYDKFNRLVLVRDHRNNIIKRICYNYNGEPGSCPTP